MDTRKALHKKAAILFIRRENDEMSEEQLGEMPAEQSEMGGKEKQENVKPEGEGRTLQDLQSELSEVRAALKDANREAAQRRKKLEEYEQAQKAREDAELSEMEKLQKRLAETESKLKAKELAELRRTAADEAKLPLVFADRLRGDTLEELKADAERLLEALPAPKIPPVSPTSPGAGASQGETLEQRRAALYGSGGNVMSPEFAKRHGGGVVMKEKPLTPPG